MSISPEVQTVRPRHHGRETSPAVVRRTARAAMLVEQRSPLVVDVIELPSLDVGQVLVKVACSGICGQQVDEISGKRGPDRFLPHLLGHEGAGVVVEVGQGVRKVRPGDHVVLHWMKGSGIDATPPTCFLHGRSINAGGVTTFSDYTVVSENRVTAIPNTVGFEAACLLGCAVTTGLGIVFNEAAIRPGQSIVVFGAGGVGLNVVQGAALVNAYPIVAVDRVEQKLGQAVAFGATHTISATRGDLKTFLMDLTAGRGCEVAVDTTGNAAVFQTAYEVTSRSGKTVMAGVHDCLQPITIDPYALHFGRQMLGSHGGASQPDVDIPRYIQLYQLGKLKLDEQITHRYRLDDVNEALETVRRGAAGRCVMVMDS